MGELQYAQTSGATRIFFYVQTFIGNRTNREESFDSHPPFGLTWTGTASSQIPTPLLSTTYILVLVLPVVKINLILLVY